MISTHFAPGFLEPIRGNPLYLGVLIVLVWSLLVSGLSAALALIICRKWDSLFISARRRSTANVQLAAQKWWQMHEKTITVHARGAGTLYIKGQGTIIEDGNIRSFDNESEERISFTDINVQVYGTVSFQFDSAGFLWLENGGTILLTGGGRISCQLGRTIAHPLADTKVCRCRNVIVSANRLQEVKAVACNGIFVNDRIQLKANDCDDVQVSGHCRGLAVNCRNVSASDHVALYAYNCKKVAAHGNSHVLYKHCKDVRSYLDAVVEMDKSVK